LSTGSGM
jgi:hypothetical protein